jgi:hypothetical protein
MDDGDRTGIPRWAVVLLIVTAVIGVGYVSAVVPRRGAEDSAAAVLAERRPWPFLVPVERSARFGSHGAFLDVSYYASFFGIRFRIYRDALMVS